MDLIRREAMETLENPGVASLQLLNPDNSDSRRVTLTRVTVSPGASQPRHTHEAAEQIWVALAGEGTLLLAESREERFRPGDVARFADGDVHGLRNDGEEAFVYLSVTSPPLSFAAAYERKTPGQAPERKE